MKSRKIFTLISICIVSVLIFSGCSTGLLDPSSPVGLELWHYYNGPQKEAFDNLVNEFNETVGREKGIVVEAFSQGSTADLLTKLTDSVNENVGAQELPDIFAAYADTAFELDEFGVVANLDNYFSEEELAEYVPSYINEGRFGEDNALKILPIAKSTEILTINKTDWDIFANDTGTTTEELSTIEGITSVSQKYYEWTDAQTPDIAEDGKMFFGRDSMANYFIAGMKQQGFDIFSTLPTGEVTFQLDEAAMRKLWDNYYIPYINGYIGKLGKFCTDDVKTGDSLAYVGSTSGSAYFPTEVSLSDTESYPIEALVLPNPCFDGLPRISIQQGAGMVVTKSDEKTEYAASEFLKWFTSAEQNIGFVSSSGYIPVKTESNNRTFIEESFATQSSLTPVLVDSVLVSVDQVNSDEMYTNSAFVNGFSARNVLEYSLSDKAAADRATVVAALKGGSGREEAVAPFLTDENFSSWLVDLTIALEETQQ